MVARATLPRASAAAASSSSSSVSSASNFSRLLASSRLASHTPAVPQVYTAPAGHLARGDFGLKRPLPIRNKPVGAVRYADVDAIDTRERQTAWTEREHEVLMLKRFRELNVRLSQKSESKNSGLPFDPNPNASSERYSRGALGPRISTTFDPSTRRTVPALYQDVPDQALREHLQNEARLGRGPVYRDGIHAGDAVASGLDRDGPYGRAASAYSHTVPLMIDYRTMDEKTFEKFLEYVRRQRPLYRQHASFRAARDERRGLAMRYNAERQKILNAASRRPEGSEAMKVPEPVAESVLPLPNTNASQARTADVETETDNDANFATDMWDESRIETSSSGLWRPWLRYRDDMRAARTTDVTLPPEPSAGGSVRNASLHPQGGLQYGQPDGIQTQLLADAVPGRVLERAVGEGSHSRARNSQGAHVAVGGRIAFMPQNAGPTMKLIDWSQRDPQKGVVNLKPTTATRLVANARQDPLPVWGGKGSEINKSASASLLVRQAAGEAAASESGTDPLRSDSLSPQYGTVNLVVRATEGAGRYSMACGVPGSAEWIGQIDGRLGYRPGETSDAPMDYANLVTMAGQPRSARGAGDSLYSRRERDKALRHAASKSAKSGRPAPHYGAPQRLHVEHLVNERRAAAAARRQQQQKTKATVEESAATDGKNE